MHLINTEKNALYFKIIPTLHTNIWCCFPYMLFFCRSLFDTDMIDCLMY